MCIHGTNCMNLRNAIIFTSVLAPLLQLLEIYKRPKRSLYDHPSIQRRRYQSRKLFMSTRRICSCNSSNGRHDVKEATLQMRTLCWLNLDSGTSVENLHDVISKQIPSSTLSISSTASLRSAAHVQAAQHGTSH